MPLRLGCAEDDINANIEILIAEGYSGEQAAAIAHGRCEGKDARAIMRYYFGGHVKAAGDGMIEGYLIPYTDADHRDLANEFFNHETKRLEHDYPIVGRPVLYQHGYDAKLGVRVIGKIITANEDEFGVWIRAQLDLRDEYERAIHQLVIDGKLDFSSGALPQGVIINEETGHIKQWPIIEGSLTPTPAMPMRTRVHTVKTLLDALKGRLDEGAMDTEALHNIKNQQKIERMAQKMSAKQLTIDKIREILGSALEAALQQLMEIAEVPTEEQEVEEMTSEMAQRAEDMIEDDEEIKQEIEEEEEIEETVEKWVNKNLDKLMPSKIKTYIERKEARQREITEAAKAAVSGVRNGVIGSSLKKQVGSYHNDTAQSIPHISVGEEQRFARLTGEEMALGCKLISAALYPFGCPPGLKLGALGLSESYIRTMVHKAQGDLQRAPSDVFEKYGDKMLLQDRYAVKAALPFKANELDAVATANQGAEWAYIWYDTRLWERARAETKLFNMMVERGMRTADVTGKSMNVKLNTSSPIVYTIPEAQSVGADGRPETVAQVTPFGTNEVEENVKRHALATSFTDQLNEQSIIDIVSFINADATQTIAEALENGLINGDKTTTSANINTDSTPASGMQSPLYLWADGIRHNWLIDNTSQRYDAGGGLTIETYLSVIGLFDSVIQPRTGNMIFIIDYATNIATRKLPELKTVEVAGPRATIFSGTLPPLFDVPVLVSAFAYKSQADGTISDTPANNTLGTINCIYAPYWQYGRSRAVNIELERHAQSQATVVVLSVAHALKARGEDAACGARNVGV